MIQKFVNRFMEYKPAIREAFDKVEPQGYTDILRTVLQFLHNPDDYPTISKTVIHDIDDGDWQGTLLFVIPAYDYQPATYWYTKVWYGSCSGCDTYQAIRECENKETRLDDYMTLALHMVQGLTEI